ncbi:hypothetical protein [Leptospira kanakyensis]|uniref:hypothetical protein n=1 Tax=Leptospira kanakyensis TaxID=2484968 RepID=UPI00223CBE53|nr:hypothetical protein [Leptospira kanakyensis]MCW7471512.1 hypothetical protein [Leptospira kanakyensis]MCW7482243.1 hypothetical protein [Leptospira kanakyensis]
MLKIFHVLLVISLFFPNCTNFYSPFGISGEDVKKQLEEHRTNLSFVSFLSLISASIATSSNSSSNYTCSTESTAIPPLATATTAANFTLPTATTYVDLSVTSGGTQYFRSNIVSSATRISGKILKTPNTSSTAICYYTTDSVCGTADLSGITINSSISSLMTIHAGTCLAIQCNGNAYVRLKEYSVDSPSTAVLGSVMGIFNAPYIFEAVTRLGDRTYYTMESFDRCKKEITNFALIEIQYSSVVSSQLTEVSNCNKPNSMIQTAALDPSLTASLQADACDLEPVNLIGL